MQQLDGAIVEDWLSENAIYCERLNGYFNAKHCPQRSYACGECPRGVGSKKTESQQKPRGKRHALAD